MVSFPHGIWGRSVWLSYQLFCVRCPTAHLNFSHPRLPGTQPPEFPFECTQEAQQFCLWSHVCLCSTDAWPAIGRPLQCVLCISCGPVLMARKRVSGKCLFSLCRVLWWCLVWSVSSNLLYKQVFPDQQCPWHQKVPLGAPTADMYLCVGLFDIKMGHY